MTSKTQIDINRITIRPATSKSEVEEIKELLSNYHPLGCNRAKGQRMYYVASHGRDWVAVMVFDGAVWSNRMREREIGWNNSQRDARLKHIANNSRFLVGKRYQGLPNVASKVLHLVAERISHDWLRRYGIPLLSLETYVDPQHNSNQGTCYTAAGWSNLGTSTGYQAFGEERTHGKLYFLKPLHSNSYAALRSDIPHALMTGVKKVSGESNNNFVLDASKFDMKSLQKALTGVSDPRTKHGVRYKFIPLLSLCIAAAMSGQTQYRQMADWIRTIPAPDRVRFGLRGDTTPSETTIGSLLRAINPVELGSVLTGWLQATYPRRDDYERIILDGKALRATAAETSKQVGFLNVFAADLGIVIEQLPCPKGGGEKTAAKQFVDSRNDLEGKIILADAIHTDSLFIEKVQKKTARMSSLLKIITQS